MESNPFWANRELERLLCEYTGAPHCIVVDNCCNALFLCLRWFSKLAGETIEIPAHTYIGVPYAIKAAGFQPVAVPNPEPPYLEGPYQLKPFPVWDCALRLTAGMYVPGTYQCLSFTGPYKHLKLGKGGAILTDNDAAAIWLRRASYSGRNYTSYHQDTFTMPEGYNMYMPVQTAAHGLHIIAGLPQTNEDIRLPYPDWSTHPAFNHANQT